MTDIGCRGIPVLTVLNKIDAVNEDSAIHLLRLRVPGAVEVSASRGEGVEQLTEEVRRQVRATVIHEIAHHFGIGEDRLRELGWG